MSKDIHLTWLSYELKPLNTFLFINYIPVIVLIFKNNTWWRIDILAGLENSIRAPVSTKVLILIIWTLFNIHIVKTRRSLSIAIPTLNQKIKIYNLSKYKTRNHLQRIITDFYYYYLISSWASKFTQGRFISRVK